MNTPEMLNEFLDALKKLDPNLRTEVDKPDDPSGQWFVDIYNEHFKTTMSWEPANGFGFYTSEQGYGNRPNELFRTANLAARRLMQLLAQWRVSNTLSPLWLAQLRQLIGTPQADLASALSRNQPAISRLESRDDLKLSTLVSYLDAMGGHLEMRVHFDKLDVSIDLPNPALKVR